MLYYPLRLVKELEAKKSIVVVGHKADKVKGAFKNGPSGPGPSGREWGPSGRERRKITFCLQSPQLGTGHALMCASKELKGFTGDLLILSGDVPLITKQTLNALFKIHRTVTDRPVLSLITVFLGDPSGYGRVIRDEEGTVKGVVEDKDLRPGERAINEVNSGIYLASSKFLFENLKKLSKKTAQGEYYLPDLVALATAQGKRVSALTHFDPNEVMGINNRVELARAASVMRERINTELMLNGVTIIDPDVTYIDYGVKAGKDTTIHPNVHLLGQTSVGAGCTVEEGVRIADSTIGSTTTVKSFSVIESSKVGKGVSIGPFARLRPENTIGDGARVGNFVEVKKTLLGKGSKANHLTYLGDSVIGNDVNIGAGTITCNYDGFKKYVTRIRDGAFIGSDSQLIAPVTVGKNAYIGSGSTITKDVPAGSLAVWIHRAQGGRGCDP
jgi:bifunctional UDP-N-acetylglucosamine pyrophosphorylase/glucosamine-1-phosphate N-acetyltransferase